MKWITKLSSLTFCAMTLFMTPGCHKLLELANEGHERPVHYDAQGNELPETGPNSHSHLLFEARMKEKSRSARMGKMADLDKDEEELAVQQGTPVNPN